MNADLFAQILEKFQTNLDRLYQNAKTSERSSADLLSAAYKELGTASEELQVAAEELSVQSEELVIARSQIEAERRHYQELFEYLPQAYILTDAQATILQANHAAATLLNIESRFLIGKPLEVFFTHRERQKFTNKLHQLAQRNCTQKWKVHLQPRHQEPFETMLTVVPSHDLEGNLVTIRWGFQALAEDKPILQEYNGFDPTSERPRYFFDKGEIVPLNCSEVWLICQGLVKLSTTAESGEDVLVGLVGESMLFGMNLTTLPIYQATILSQRAELVRISLQEIGDSPDLSQALLPKLIQRLRQTEALLAITLKRQARSRIHAFLLWLKQEFGEPVSQGIRLRVRLTQQELAEACCTTRVTITRELSQLKQQGKIVYDRDRHMIFTEEGHRLS